MSLVHILQAVLLQDTYLSQGTWHLKFIGFRHDLVSLLMIIYSNQVFIFGTLNFVNVKVDNTLCLRVGSFKVSLSNK
jgi:hypothetical protein